MIESALCLKQATMKPTLLSPLVCSWERTARGRRGRTQVCVLCSADGPGGAAAPPFGHESPDEPLLWFLYLWNLVRPRRPRFLYPFSNRHY